MQKIKKKWTCGKSKREMAKIILNKKIGLHLSRNYK